MSSLSTRQLLSLFSHLERSGMETILSFFSSLLLFTAGLAVLLLWLFIIVVVVDEAIDLVFSRKSHNKEES